MTTVKTVVRKKFAYSGEGDESGGNVEYVIIGNRCFFAGTSWGTGIRKPNSATNEIVLKILKDEGRVPADLTFFEVMTRSAYGYIVPGTCQFERVGVIPIPTGINTLRTLVPSVPAFAWETFQDIIDAETAQ